MHDVVITTGLTLDHSRRHASVPSSPSSPSSLSQQSRTQARFVFEDALILVWVAIAALLLPAASNNRVGAFWLIVGFVAVEA